MLRKLPSKICFNTLEGKEMSLILFHKLQPMFGKRTHHMQILKLDDIRQRTALYLMGSFKIFLLIKH
ncbi:ASN_collapsed_G0051460.mRNA.1.CDS.1 [Saccharomyces cerevisiae]|nr:ASN_collapsed_G0051460.mRNA.1.CDS.1 [Saccharomyces cerevisiae]